MGTTHRRRNFWIYGRCNRLKRLKAGIRERLVFHIVLCFSWWWAISIIQSLLNLQAYENLTFTTEEVLWSEVLDKMRTEMQVFFSSKTSSLKVWRLKSWCGRYRLGKIHLKLNPAYNVYNPVNWQHFSAEAFIRKSYLASGSLIDNTACDFNIFLTFSVSFLALKIALVMPFWYNFYEPCCTLTFFQRP